MRIISEIPSTNYKIMLYGWNGKYIIKIEDGMFEQTYKISEFDVTSDQEAINLVDTEFLTEVAKRFGQMFTDWENAKVRNNIF